MRIPTELLRQFERGPTIFSDGRSLSHRMLVIQSVCDLEAEIGDLLVEFARRSNPGLTLKQARDCLLDEGRPFYGLKRAANAAFAFGLIDSQVRGDLNTLSLMRDKYAHDQHRKQLEEDSEMLARLQSLTLWKDNPELHPRRAQEALRCMVAHLRDVLSATKNSLVPPKA